MNSIACGLYTPVAVLALVWVVVSCATNPAGADNAVAEAEGTPDVLLVKGEEFENEASDAIAHLLRDRLGLNAAFVEWDALGETDLGGVKLLVAPGGNASAVDPSPKAVARVRGAVASGMGYMGICCGAFQAVEGVSFTGNLAGLTPPGGNSFRIFSGMAEAIGGSGVTRPFHIDVDHPIIANSSFADEISPVMDMVFAGSTANIIPCYADSLSNWCVATLDAPADGRPVGRRAVMTSTLFGAGRVFLFGPHPELSEETHPLVLAAAEWCTGISDPERAEAPVVVADIPEHGTVQQFLVCSAAGSHDPGGLPVGFIWDFGPLVPRQHGPEALYVFTRPGTYTVTVTVTNGTRHSAASGEVPVAGNASDDARVEAEVTLTNEQAAVLVGSYRLEAPPEVLEVVGEILEVEWADQQLTLGSKVAVVPLVATSPTEFTGPDGVELKFVIGKEGKATQILVTAAGLGDTRATRVD